MDRYHVKGKYLFPVHTYVTAESREEAIEIAKSRHVGDLADPDLEWVFDEEEFPNRKFN